MASKIQQADKLLQLKKLRADSSKARTMRAAALLHLARVQEDAAHSGLAETRAHASERRNERLSALFESEADHASLQSLAVSAWIKTDEDIARASSEVIQAIQAREVGEEGLRLAQQDLARTMRAQRKAEELLSLETTRAREARGRQG